MINLALEALRKSIHDYLIRLSELNINNSDEPVHLTSIVRDDGTIAIPDNSLGVSLVSIEEERVNKSQQTIKKAPNGKILHLNPEIMLNLYILVTANFGDYSTGLSFLSGAIRFFQSKDVFTPQNTPSLDPAIEKMVVDLFTTDFEQQNHLWAALGAKYLPSVMYKIRVITIQEGQASEEGPPILEVNSTERSI